ncbi:ribonuclease H-related protein [Emticicia oligotrophica DSM 17448]|uniref:Ribonuclease H n=1 Tax=Emticicia oligotrophica (strain DSM 17448 / CIP 109782 / MTCC 6937 / GPTSA100-15) TaxID=929562 RepID=A0ABM5N332_EMTOG|nr:ribonuclease H family protein [Emticicia oligotrophica]AFK03824.1 ribonuclease H-related protein [Emticicia oligotrophica DSM 17448]
MAKKQKFYTVWEGRNKGVFDSWDECKKQVEGVQGAKYKAFDSKTEAVKALEENYWKYVQNAEQKQTKIPKSAFPPPMLESIVVDAAWNSVKKDMEYQGFYLRTKERIFHKGPFPQATNNIGEFLAIVHALAFLKKQNSNLPIYSDSRTAISWVKNKKANTKLDEATGNPEIFDLLERAEKWLKDNTYPNKVLKWETDYWGENPADFGRK